MHLDKLCHGRVDDYAAQLFMLVFVLERFKITVVAVSKRCIRIGGVEMLLPRNS